MIKAKDKKKETLAYRARAKAVDEMMQAGAGRAAPPEMATPAPRGRAMPAPEMAPPPGMAPPGMGAPGMKKGGKVTAMKKGGKVPPKKGGIMIMIAMGKKKGK
jgi:hypothetical protein